MIHPIAALPSITPAGDPAVLAHSVSSSSSAIAAQSSQLEGEGGDDQASGPSGPAEQHKTPEEEELDRQIEALAVPGFALHQEGVFTVIRRVRRTGRSRTFPARLARWLLQSDKWLPVLFRYFKDSFLLSPWRMCIHIIYRILQSQVPLARLWASTKIRAMVEEAIGTGHVDKLKLALFVTLSGMLSTGFRSVKLFFAKNTGILERKFGAMLTSRLLGVMGNLDYPAATDPLNNKLIQDASRTVQAGSDRAFSVVSDIIKLFTTLTGVFSQAEYLRRCLTRNNIDIFVIGLVANFVKSAEWLFLGDSGVYSGVTNTDYHRMEHLWTEAISRVPEDNILGLPQYYHEEYKKADMKMGDLWTSRLRELSSIRRATTYLKSFSNPAIYALFAIRASSRRAGDVSLGRLTTDMLNFIEMATSSLADEVAAFFYVLDDVRQHCSEILQYYRVLDLKPRLSVPDVPAKYTRQLLSMGEGGPTISGMTIEIRDVTYKYPDSDGNALNKVNFTIKAGSLVCIVGYNGAGKSTLINLMTRIVDPTSGTVLINGIDAKQYEPKDLYSYVSCQFQETFPANFTIREWLHMGDTSDVHDEEKMQECLRITGADKVIAKFSKGLEARLGPYPADDSPQSLLREYIRETKTGGYDPWEANYDKKIEQEIEADEDYDDSVTSNGALRKKDCAFSPGEWSKLVFARALMKKNVDLRVFDEPTAKLDPIASRAVFDQIESLRGTSTVIHITHDLSACLKADQVILFEDGTNVESGTHEDLLATPDSKYRQFYFASLGHKHDGEDDEDDTGYADGHGSVPVGDSLDESLGATFQDASLESADLSAPRSVDVNGESIDEHAPRIILLSMYGDDHEYGELSESAEEGFGQLEQIGLGITPPERSPCRFEELGSGDEGDDQEVLQGTAEEDDEDDGNDSGFEGASQASFCPEEVVPRKV